MKRPYCEPLARIRPLEFDRAFCLSEVPSLGGTTTDYVEDNENLNG